jgi:hypothetical protein
MILIHINPFKNVKARNRQCRASIVDGICGTPVAINFTPGKSNKQLILF